MELRASGYESMVIRDTRVLYFVKPHPAAALYSLPNSQADIAVPI